MPEEFDPAWEYACGDPEIEEIIYGKQPKQFAGLSLSCDEDENVGHRFGKVAVFPPRVCERTECGTDFSPRWQRQLYCCYACSRVVRRQQEKSYGKRQTGRHKLTRNGGVFVAVKVGDRVMLEVPDNLIVHKQFGVVKEVTLYGAVVSWRNNTREFRAFAHEMTPLVQTGNSCDKCGSTNLVRAGTCLLCQDCGDTSGGCG